MGQVDHTFEDGLDSHCYRGFHFQSWADEYAFECPGPPEATLERIRRFYGARGAALLEQHEHLLFARGKRGLYAQYISISEMTKPHRIRVDVCESLDAGSVVSITYQVEIGMGWRTRPYETKREVRELMLQLHAP
jgi:hypothetical protein